MVVVRRTRCTSVLASTVLGKLFSYYTNYTCFQPALLSRTRSGSAGGVVTGVYSLGDTCTACKARTRLAALQSCEA
jgi:hypothetical protein